MAYGKQIFVTTTATIDVLAEIGTAGEYVEILEDGTTFHTYTPASTTISKIKDAASVGNKLADDTTPANRFVWTAGQVVRIPVVALKLATGSVCIYSSPTEV
ncbi:MAG: hypothetical protein LC115_08250 [Bacteroidia bacterium]|nr:hypothetical protein [Chitinophagaceae bacterium]MCZ2356663.1 hypothetical protein [Bacteroidia bacterium]